MKQATFFLNSKELLVVEYEHPVERETTRLLYSPEIATPYKEFKLIGKLSEVTEEQYKGLVEVDKENWWKDYMEKDPEYYPFVFVNAKESFLSKLEAEEILFKNPFGSHPDNWTYTTEAMHMKNPDIKAWQSAQEKVFKIENTFLFEKV